MHNVNAIPPPYLETPNHFLLGNGGVAYPTTQNDTARTLPGSGDRASARDKVFAFLLGLGTRLQVQVIGYLPFTEIFILLTLPHFFGRTMSSSNVRRTGLCLPLLLVWLASLMCSDLYRETQWSLAARGVARIVVFLLAIPFFTWFLRTGCYDKVLWWTVGSLPSFILSAYIFRGGVHEGREMLYGHADIKYDTHWGGAVSLAVVIFSLIVYRRQRILCYVANVALGFFHIANSMRAAGAYTILSAAITAALNALRGRREMLLGGRRIAAWKLIVIVLASLVVSQGVVYWYGESARAGQFGERARRKYESQVRNKYGLLAGGRPEFVGGLLAISESPLLGYGSWPIDHDRFFLRACDLMEVKLAPDYYTRGYPLIPTHSHILGAWVESGVMAVFFWVYVLVVATRAIYCPIRDEVRLRFWVVSSCLSLIWAIFFSPISARLETSFLIGALFNQVVWSGSGLAALPPSATPLAGRQAA